MSGQVKGHLILDSSHSQQVRDKAKPMAKECGTILNLVCRYVLNDKPKCAVH